VERKWFDGKLTVNAIAMLLFIRACSGAEARPWHIAKRFNWSYGTIKTLGKELEAAGLVKRRGGAQQPIYCCSNSQKTNSKNVDSENGNSKRQNSEKSARLPNDQPLRIDHPSRNEQLARIATADRYSDEGGWNDTAIGASWSEYRDQAQVKLAESGAANFLSELLPFTRRTLERIKDMGCDVSAIVARYEERVGCRSDIRDPDAYLLAIAAEEAEKSHGLPRGAILPRSVRSSSGSVTMRSKPSREAQSKMQVILAGSGLSLPVLLVDWTIETEGMQFESDEEVDRHFERYVQGRLNRLPFR
jgi:hypothetical protein